MEDFYKQFKNSYDSREEPEFNPADWENLEKMLDEDDKKGFFLPFPLWFLAMPFIALLGWNVWLQSTLSHNDKSELVENRVESQRLASSTTDTVYKKELVYLTDTIYINNALINRMPEKTRIIYQDRIVYRDNPVYFKKDLKFGWVELGDEEMKEALIMESGNGIVGSKEKSDILFGTKRRRSGYLNMGSLPMYSTKLRSNSKSRARQSLAFSPQLDVEAISKRRQNQRYFRPVGFEAYIGTGLIYTSQAELTNLTSTSQHLGLKLSFAPGYSVWLEGAYQAMNFKTSSMNDEIGVPVITPPSDEFEFENAEIKRFAIQYSAGIDYTFYRRNRLRPFVGFGITAVRYLQSDIFYDFYNKTTGQEWIFEEEPEAVPTAYGYGLVKAGLEYSISRKVDLQLTGTYRRNAMDSFGNENMFGGHLSLKAKLF